MRAFLIILAILVALVFGVLFAAPLVIDPEDYRGDVQAGLSRALGQPVRLEGELAFRILPTPGLPPAAWWWRAVRRATSIRS